MLTAVAGFKYLSHKVDCQGGRFHVKLVLKVNDRSLILKNNFERLDQASDWVLKVKHGKWDTAELKKEVAKWGVLG